MTDQKHTKEPWQFDGLVYIWGPEQQMIADSHDDTDYLVRMRGVGSGMVESGEQEANAKRIVECVNACAGIESPLDLRAKLDAVTRQRDELREALEIASYKIAEMLHHGAFEENEVMNFKNAQIKINDVLTKNKEDV